MLKESASPRKVERSVTVGEFHPIVSKNKFICFCDIQGKEARHQGPAILTLHITSIIY
jgi:hypothetical protein